ncbi:MAG: hypothetical protein R2873_24685 [Caldilineaceae bacterium]
MRNLSLFSDLSAEVRQVQALFYINAVLWLVFGAATILRISTINPGAQALMATLAVLMFGNVFALLIGGMVLDKRTRWAYALAMTVLLINTALTITDDFGLFDAIVLVLNVATLWFLAKMAGWYWRKQAS